MAINFHIRKHDFQTSEMTRTSNLLRSGSMLFRNIEAPPIESMHAASPFWRPPPQPLRSPLERYSTSLSNHDFQPEATHIKREVAFC